MAQYRIDSRQAAAPLHAPLSSAMSRLAASVQAEPSNSTRILVHCFSRCHANLLALSCILPCVSAAVLPLAQMCTCYKAVKSCLAGLRLHASFTGQGRVWDPTPIFSGCCCRDAFDKSEHKLKLPNLELPAEVWYELSLRRKAHTEENDVGIQACTNIISWPYPCFSASAVCCVPQHALPSLVPPVLLAFAYKLQAHVHTKCLASTD